MKYLGKKSVVNQNLLQEARNNKWNWTGHTLRIEMTGGLTNNQLVRYVLKKKKVIKTRWDEGIAKYMNNRNYERVTKDKYEKDKPSVRLLPKTRKFCEKYCIMYEINEDYYFIEFCLKCMQEAMCVSVFCVPCGVKLTAA